MLLTDSKYEVRYIDYLESSSLRRSNEAGKLYCYSIVPLVEE